MSLGREIGALVGGGIPRLRNLKIGRLAGWGLSRFEDGRYMRK